MSQIKDTPSDKSVLLSVSAKKILEEDEYLDRMAKIIKRDFFSDSSATPLIDCQGFTPATDRTNSTTTSSVRSRREACSLSLNEFLDKYTSEDNAYFEKLQRKELKRHRSRFPWLYDKRQKKASQTLAVTSSSSSPLSIEGPSREKDRQQSTINYHSNKFLDYRFKEPLPVSGTSKTATFNRFNDKFGIDGRPLSESLTPLRKDEPSPFIVPDTPKPTVLEHKVKTEPNRFYIPNESPRDELAHRVYQEKVAKNIRTPKTNPHRDSSSRGTVRSTVFNN